MDIPKKKHVLLILILLLAFYLNFTPHMNYPYPVHVDEWQNYAISQAIVKEEGVIYTEPFIGENIVSNDLEIGLRVLIAVFQEITGFSWFFIFRYMPSIIFMITVLGTYVFANRGGYGLHAAFLVALIPTSVRLIGPGFLVAVGVGLLFIPLTLFLLFNSRKYLLLVIFVTYLFLLHPPTALALIAILIPFILLNYRNDPRNSVYLTIALMVAFLVSSPRLMHLVAPTAERMVNTSTYYLPLAPEVYNVYGYLQTLIFFIGVYMLSKCGKIKDFSLIYASVLLLVPIVLFSQFDIGYGIIYDRNYSYLNILMSIIGGYGLFKLSAYLKKFKLGNVVLLIFVISILANAMVTHANAPYYHIMNKQEYEDFSWIKENLGDVQGKSVLDPWKARAYVPITGRFVYSNIPLGPSEFHEKRNRDIYEFFGDGGKNSTFLKVNGISIVYSKTPITNTDLTEVHPRVYVYTEG